MGVVEGVFCRWEGWRLIGHLLVLALLHEFVDPETDQADADWGAARQCQWMKHGGDWARGELPMKTMQKTRTTPGLWAAQLERLASWARGWRAMSWWLRTAIVVEEEEEEGLVTGMRERGGLNEGIKERMTGQ